MPRDRLSGRELDELIQREDVALSDFDWFADKLVRPQEERYRWR